MGTDVNNAVKKLRRRIQCDARRLLSFVLASVAHVARLKALPVKDRYMFTRRGRLRLRYIVLIAAGFFGLSMTNMSWEPQSLYISPAYAANFGAQVVQPQVVAMPQPPIDMETLASGIAPKPAAPRPDNWIKTIKIAKGQTLTSLLTSASFTVDEAAAAVRALDGHIDPKALRAGQDVKVHYRANDGMPGDYWTNVEFGVSGLSTVVLTRGAGTTDLRAETVEKKVTQERRAIRTKIHSSLYADLARAGVPDSIVAEFIKAYSYNIDFARDIWAGDTVEILYDVDRTEDGKYVKGNRLLYANLSLRGKVYNIYSFERDGGVEYFNEKGMPVKKALMRTPIDGARVTSGFGMRRHPILGYSKMHKGVDFGAPTGTPIYAAGDGTVEKAGWSGGYGKYVRIKHNGTFASAYGHMSAIAVKAGQRVRQGQIIGRVGTTGRSTGPHLHFEVLKAGAQVNPKSVDMSVGSGLGGKAMSKFRNVSFDAKTQFNKLIDAARLRSASIN